MKPCLLIEKHFLWISRRSNVENPNAESWLHTRVQFCLNWIHQSGLQHTLGRLHKESFSFSLPLRSNHFFISLLFVSNHSTSGVTHTVYLGTLNYKREIVCPPHQNECLSLSLPKGSVAWNWTVSDCIFQDWLCFWNNDRTDLDLISLVKG